MGSVASVFCVSRWGRGDQRQGARHYRNRLGVAIAARTYKAARGLLNSPAAPRLQQRACGRNGWSGTGTKSRASDVLYIKPSNFHCEHHAQATLKALAKHSKLGRDHVPTGRW